MRLPLCVLAALLCCHAGCTDRSDPRPPPQLQLETASEFRFLATESPGPRHVLRWQRPSAGPDPVAYRVYRAPFEIQAGNKHTATRYDVAAGPASAIDAELRLDLGPDTGRMFFAVETERADGSVGPLSENVVVDTAQRVAWLEEDQAGLRALFFRAVSGGGATALLEGAIEDFAWSPTGAAVGVLRGNGELTFLDVEPGPVGLPVVLLTSQAPPPRATAFRYGPRVQRFAFIGHGWASALPSHLHVATGHARNFRRISSFSDPGGVIEDFSWAPNGRRIAYLADGDDPGTEHLYLDSVAAPGTPARLDRRLSADEYVAAAAWAPEREDVAYLVHATDRDEVEIALIDAAPVLANGNEPAPRVIARGQSQIDGALRWSPDGSTLAYLLRAEGAPGQELYLQAAAGGSPSRVNEPLAAGSDVVAVRWAPGSDGVAFLLRDQAGHKELMLGGVAPIRLHPPLGPGQSIGAFAWSPDGSHVAFVLEDAGPAGASLHVVDRSGNEVAAETGLGVGGPIGFGPDGRLVAFLGTRPQSPRAELWVLDVAAGQSTRVSNAEVSDRSVVAFRWSRLGWRVAPGFRAPLRAPSVERSR